MKIHTDKMADMIGDDRFSHLPKDPRFRRMPKNERKVKIDKRFKDMFTDKRFKLKYSVDKRGRPINTTTNENLKKYYELSDENEFDSEEESEDETNTTKLQKPIKNQPEKETFREKGKSLKEKTEMIDTKVDRKSGRKNTKKEVKEEDEDSIDGEEDSEEESEDEMNLDQDNLPDFARGEGNLESSSDEDDVQNEEDEDEDDFEHNWGEFDRNVPEVKELSCRLAVCNMDWDRIKAQDLFMIMNSFLPSGGTIKAVTIYPSEFGLQRMKEEATKGPVDLIIDKEAGSSGKPTTKEEDDSSDAEDFEGGSYHRERLRQYQLNRLKYFYAVVITDSKETANHIYEECDGMEYESSSAKLDLRFIPDDMTFDQEPKSVCTEIGHSSSYKPSLFCTTALSQSKVDLTWDETDKDRIKVTMRDHKKMKGKNAEELKEDDFKAYLASSSDEEDPYSNLIEQSDDSEESDEDKQIEKYKSLLQTLKESESKKDDRDVEMEVSWEPGLKETTEKIIKKKQEEKGQSAWEKYLTKRKEIKQERREKKRKIKQKIREQDNNSSDENEVGSSDEAAFSDDCVPEGVDADSPLYNDDHVSSNTKQGVKNKKKKKKKVKNETELTAEEKSREAELSLLMMDKNDDGRKHFSLKSLMEENKKGSKKDKKKKLKEQRKDKTQSDDFEIDVSDQRFSALYNSHLFNIDPSAPEFKRTKGVEAIIDEKLKRRKSEKRDKQDGNKLKRKADSKDMKEETLTKMSKESKSDTPVPSSKADASLASLVKSVKNKTQAHYVKKKK